MQRYELELALPIRRLAGNRRGSVCASKPELDAWIAACPIRKAFPIAKPMFASKCADAASEIKKALAQTRELHQEMRDLRADLSASVQFLSQQVQALQEELNAENVRNAGFSANLLNYGRETEDLVSLVRSPSRQRKAIQP